MWSNDMCTYVLIFVFLPETVCSVFHTTCNNILDNNTDHYGNANLNHYNNYYDNPDNNHCYNNNIHNNNYHNDNNNNNNYYYYYYKTATDAVERPPCGLNRPRGNCNF